MNELCLANQKYDGVFFFSHRIRLTRTDMQRIYSELVTRIIIPRGRIRIQVITRRPPVACPSLEL